MLGSYHNSEILFSPVCENTYTSVLEIAILIEIISFSVDEAFNGSIADRKFCVGLTHACTAAAARALDFGSTPQLKVTQPGSQQSCRRTVVLGA